MKEASVHMENSMRRIPAVAFSFFLAVLFVAAKDGDAPRDKQNNAAFWESIWQRNSVDIGNPSHEYIKSADDLGKDIEGKEWNKLSTKYHLVYYQPSLEKDKLQQVVLYLDNLYDFLKKWNPAAPRTPIKTFLVPNEMGHSRCSRNSNSMRTGDKGDAVFMVTSLLHEETHLFNFAYLGARPQNWWAGEFSCIYFQSRARMLAEKTDILQFVISKLPNGPKSALGEIAAAASQKITDSIFDEAFSAMYFLHATYGDDKFRAFREELLSLDTSINVTGTERAFKRAYGAGFADLDHQWRNFYKWDGENTKVSENLISGDQQAQKGAHITAGEVVAELAGSGYKGRATGGPGEELAGNYIRDCFRRIGLQPLMTNGEFYQPFNVPYRDLTGPIGLKINGRDYKYKEDFGILVGGPAEWRTGEMRYVGFGIQSDGLFDADFKSLRGRVLIALYKGKNNSNMRNIMDLAKRSGAIGVLLVDPPGLSDPQVFARKNVSIRNEIPTLHVSPGVGEFVLSLDESGLTKLFAKLQAGKAPKVDIKGTCSLAAGSIETPSKSRNILARLAASKPRKKNILIYAHYDGQGRDDGGKYYPSANDNASGVAVMLATASILSDRIDNLAEDVFFAALGAEEVGYVGASALLYGNVIDWNDIDFAICLDMVGEAPGKRMTVQTVSADMPIYRSFKSYV
jgi:hypothetical protein